MKDFYPGKIFDVSYPHQSIDNLWWNVHGRVLAVEPLGAVEPCYTREPHFSTRILQGTVYDPGSAAFRFHSAMNECTNQVSAFVRWMHTNPYCDLRQWDGNDSANHVRLLAERADVLHCHVGYDLLRNTKWKPDSRQLVVRHYHGSIPGDSWMQHEEDAKMSALRVGARLSHLAEPGADDVWWLPITIPVRRYLDLKHRTPRLGGRYRVAHSPTVRGLKGTTEFLRACARLESLVEPVLIEALPLWEALKLKATANACFDSFWNGLQGSGLEAAAMQLPVLCGDADVRDLHIAAFGYVPYTFVADEKELVATLERLALDYMFASREALRVHDYVKQYHDYASVAGVYESILATRIPIVPTPYGQTIGEARPSLQPIQGSALRLAVAAMQAKSARSSLLDSETTDSPDGAA